MAYFLNERLQQQRDDFGPMTQNVDGSKFTALFDNIPPNTNYSVQVKAETRTQIGQASHASCQMPASVPDKEKLSVSLTRYQRADKWGLRTNLPKVSQRKGPVCCYSVVLVKMLEGNPISSLPEPHRLPLLTYEEVHRVGAGAYIAELFDADRIPSDVSLGDGNRIDKTNPPCKSCSVIRWPATSDKADSEVEGDVEDDTTSRVERSSSRDAPANLINLEALSDDGALIPESNYTLFVRVNSVISLLKGKMFDLFSNLIVVVLPKYSRAS